MMLPRVKLVIERWKWSREFNMYVSNLGHFRDKHGDEVRQFVTRSGYMCVSTPRGLSLSHRVVMKTWRPTLDMDHMTIDHRDHNKRNNAVTNLVWCTMEVNHRMATADQLTYEEEKSLKPSSDVIVEKEEVASNAAYFCCYDSDHKFIHKEETIEGLTNWTLGCMYSVFSGTKFNTLKRGIQKAIESGKLYGKHYWEYGLPK